MNNSQIKSFLLAAKYENFTHAAEELYITQPVLGRQIASLENELGIELFTRSKKTVSLTASGQLIADGFKDMTAQMDSVIEKARAIQNGEAGILRIGIAANQILGRKCAEALNTVKDNYPNSIILAHSYTLYELHKKLNNGSIDLALTSDYEITDDSDYFTQFINTNNNNVLVSDFHRMANKHPKSLSEFKDEVFLNVSPTDSNPISQNLYKWCANAGFHPMVETLQDISQLPLYIETGRYAVIINDEAYINFMPFIVKFSLPEIPPVTHIAAWKKNTTSNLLLDCFINYLKEHPSDDRSSYIK